MNSSQLLRQHLWIINNLQSWIAGTVYFFLEDSVGKVIQRLFLRLCTYFYVSQEWYMVLKLSSCLVMCASSFLLYTVIFLDTAIGDMRIWIYKHCVNPVSMCKTWDPLLFLELAWPPWIQVKTHLSILFPTTSSNMIRNIGLREVVITFFILIMLGHESGCKWISQM